MRAFVSEACLRRSVGRSVGSFLILIDFVVQPRFLEISNTEHTIRGYILTLRVPITSKEMWRNVKVAFLLFLCRRWSLD